MVVICVGDTRLPNTVTIPLAVSYDGIRVLGLLKIDLPKAHHIWGRLECRPLVGTFLVEVNRISPPWLLQVLTDVIARPRITSISCKMQPKTPRILSS